MSSTAGALDQRVGADAASTQRQLLAVVVYTALALLLALAMLVLFRRLTGSFSQPLSPLRLVLAALLSELATFALRCLNRTSAFHDSVLSIPCLVLSTNRITGAKAQTADIARPVELRLTAFDLVITTSVLIIAFALALPGSSVFGLLLAGLIVIGGEIIQQLPRFRVWTIGAAHPPVSSLATIAATPPADMEELEMQTEISEPEVPVGLIQQVTRVVEDGRESIHALSKAEIAADDRLAVVHIAFCPPLTDPPELSAHALDCDDAEIRITQAESFGARIEVRLATISQTPRSLLIEVLGSAKANRCS